MMMIPTKTASNTRVSTASRAALATICAAAMTSALFVTGCSSTKTAVSVDDFNSACENAGLTVESLGDFSESVDMIEDGAYAYMTDSTYLVQFYVTDTTENAQTLYDGQKSSYEDDVDDESTDESADESADEDSGVSVSMMPEVIGDNYQSCTFSDDDTYYAVTQVDNTVLISQCPLDNEDDVTALIDELGY